MYIFFHLYVHIYIYTYLCIYVHLLDTTGIRLKIDSSHQTIHTLGILETPSRRNQPTDDSRFVSMCSPFFTGVRYGKGFKNNQPPSFRSYRFDEQNENGLPTIPFFKGKVLTFWGFNSFRKIGKKS